ncbi:CLUMA_CG014704, isoform A [Clunio marinus]|uniref:CLUMA_CG014704, isoform A n=1 Tax=Clunio marinus TaxID=568069 RepID=A0A1J1ILG3_9DIPT|nr:CLUMA_CG014704, isoform A [Clunio marinus]
MLSRFSQISLGSFTSHDMIFGCYKIKINKGKSKEMHYRNFKNISSEIIQSAASEQNWNLIYDFPNVDDQVNHVNYLTNELIEKFCPLKICRYFNETRPEWFTLKLERMINARNFLFSAMKHEKNPVRKMNYKSTYCHLRNKVNTLKRKLKWSHFMKHLNLNLPNNQLWKNLKTFGVTKSDIASKWVVDEKFIDNEGGKHGNAASNI